MNNLLYTLGRRKLFTDEEKALLNKKLPNLEAAASVSAPYSEYFSCFKSFAICHISHHSFLGTVKCAPDILAVLTY